MEKTDGTVKLTIDTNSGVAYVQRGGNFFMLEVTQSETLDGKTVDEVVEVPVKPPVSLTPSGNAYKREKK